MGGKQRGQCGENLSPYSRTRPMLRFIDEADQALGRRDASSGDSGISGRIYSMLAEEMGNSSNRGSVIWVLASSRPISSRSTSNVPAA